MRKMPLSPIKRTVQFHIVAWVIVALSSCGLNEVPSIENREKEPFQNTKCQNVLLRYGGHHLVSWKPQMGEPLRTPCSRALCYSGYRGVIATARPDRPEQAMVQIGPWRLLPPEGQFLKVRPFFGIVMGNDLALIEGPSDNELTLFDGQLMRIDRISKPSLHANHKIKYLIDEADRIWLVVKSLDEKTRRKSRQKILLRDAPGTPNIPLLDGDQVVGHLKKKDGWDLYRQGAPSLRLLAPSDVDILHARVFGDYIFLSWEGEHTLEAVYQGTSFIVRGQNGEKLFSSKKGAIRYQPEIGFDLHVNADERLALMRFKKETDVSGKELRQGVWREAMQIFFHKEQFLIRERLRDQYCSVEDRITYLDVGTGDMQTLASGEGSRAHLGFAGDAFRWVDMKTELNFVPFDG